MGFREANSRGLPLALELIHHGGKYTGGSVGLAVASSLVVSSSGSIAAAVAAAAISSLSVAHCESAAGGSCTSSSSRRSTRGWGWAPREGQCCGAQGLVVVGGTPSIAALTAEDRWWPIRRWISISLCEEFVKNQDGKVYHIELKPLLSAFSGKALLTTVLRQFITHFMPVLQYYITPDEEDEDEESPKMMHSPPPLPPPDVTLHAKRTSLSIARELAVTTTRRVLERVAVKNLSPCLAWKLTKDIQKSALRKVGRGVRGSWLFVRVCRTTIRAHVLQVAATWLVQFVTDVTNCIVKCWHLRMQKREEIGHMSKDDEEDRNTVGVEISFLAERMAGNTSRAVGSLAMASAGAGLGSLVRPGTGTYVGFLMGEIFGPMIVTFMVFDVSSRKPDNTGEGDGFNGHGFFGAGKGGL